MEVETGNRGNCATDFLSPPVTSPVVKLDAVQKAINKIAAEEQEKSDNAKEVATTDDGLDECDAAENTGAVQDSKPSPSVVANVNAKTNVGKYRLLRTIGKGNFAKVKLAIHMATGAEVAIKIINKTVMDSTLLKRLKREITIMKVTNHPNIVRLLEIIENEDVLCLVMEYASGGEIFDYLVANGKMREKEARMKFRQLLSAIQYCHAKRIVHRDLKAENILLDRNLNVKVADFGLANNFDYDQRLTTFCGSPPYAAPELFLGIPYYGPGVDVWSLGVILFTLVLGHLPFDARDLRELRSKILGLHYTIPKGAISIECEALLRKMLVLDPKDRSSLKVLMQDKWINMGYSPSEQLRPYKEPPKSQLDEVRVKAMEAMGFTRGDLESSVVNPEFDHVYATYHLLPETPSQFMVLCGEFSHCRGSLMKPDNQAAANQTPTTAIGRFTVAPSEAVPDTSTRNSLQAAAVPSTDFQSSSHKKQPPYPVVDASSREHHSLTSALPVALRKAIVHVGRTFGGGTYTSGTPNSGSSGMPDPINRTFTSGGGRGSGKPISKQTDGRATVTTAPVPISSTKKNAVVGPSKRSSPSGTTPLSVPSSGRSCSSDSNSVSQHTTTSRTGHRPPYPVANVTSQPSPSGTVDRALKTSNVKRESPPIYGKPQPVQKMSPQNTSVEAHFTDSPRESVHSSATHTTGAVVIPEVASNTSSDSYAECETRQLAATIVQKHLESMNYKNRCEEISSNSPSHNPEEPETGYLKKDAELKDTHGAVPVIRNAETLMDDVDHQLVSEGYSTTTDNQLLQTNFLGQTTKASHTVQGTEAVALRDEALRSDLSFTPAATPPQDPNSLTLDAVHQNTWSKGVLRALGGFFTPAKPHEQRQFATNDDVGFLAKPREVRFPWSVHTTSTKSAEEVLQSIIEALEVTPGCRYAYDTHLPFLVRCSWAADRPALRLETSNLPDTPRPTSMASIVSSGLREDPVHWEMEVCQLPRLHLRGVRLKRIRGSALHFRPIADLVMKSLRL